MSTEYDSILEELVDEGEVGKSLPVDGDLHVNAALTNVAISWMQDSKRFAAGRTFPVVPVQKQSDLYYVWEEGDFFRDEAREQGGNTPAPEINLRESTEQYHCKVIHVGGKVTELDAINQDKAVKKEQAIARAIAQRMMIRRESAWVTKFFSSTSGWTGATTGGNLQGVVVGGGSGGGGVPSSSEFIQWDDYGASDPIALLRREIAWLCRLGVDPMDIILTVGNGVWNRGMVDHPKFLGRYENTQTAILNEQLVAAVLGIREVVVCYASSNSAGETQTAVMAYMQGNHALLSVAPAQPEIDKPSAGYTFSLAALAGAGDEGFRMRRFQVDDPIGMKQVGEMGFDHKQTSAICGSFLKDVVSG